MIFSIYVSNWAQISLTPSISGAAKKYLTLANITVISIKSRLGKFGAVHSGSGGNFCQVGIVLAWDPVFQGIGNIRIAEVLPASKCLQSLLNLHIGRCATLDQLQKAVHSHLWSRNFHTQTFSYHSAMIWCNPDEEQQDNFHVYGGKFSRWIRKCLQLGRKIQQLSRPAHVIVRYACLKKPRKGIGN